MIKLVLEDYCQSCCQFEAKVEKNYFNSSNGITVIQCEHRETCAEIKRCIEKHLRTQAQTPVDTCVMCGEPVPEGRQVCVICEKMRRDVP